MSEYLLGKTGLELDNTSPNLTARKDINKKLIELVGNSKRK